MQLFKIPSFLVVLLATCFTLAAVESASALLLVSPNTSWQAETGTTGSWHRPNNWTNGVPNANDYVAVSNGGTVVIRRAAQARDLKLAGLTGSMVKQLRGRSQFDSLRIQRGTYELRRGVLDAVIVDVGRRPLPIAFNPPLTELPVLFDPSVGSISIAGNDNGEVPTPIDVIDEAILPPEFIPILPSITRFEQRGGSLNVEDRLSVYAGTFYMSNGRVRAGSILIDAWPPVAFNLFLPVPEFPVGMLQEGGRVNVSGEVLIQNGAYTLEGGLFRADRLALGDPAMENPSGIWAGGRMPSFVQTGGTSQITGNLEMCMPGFVGFPLLPFREVSYRLEGGRLRVGGDVIVGSMGAAPVRFMQSGGRANFGGTLRIEGDSSRYEISGGRLTTSVLEIGAGVFSTSGTFAFREAAHVTVRDRVSFGAESVFEAVPGSTMRLRGGAFENFSQNENNLAGLNDLQLIFGDTGWGGLFGESLDSTLEVGGQDLGDVDEGFDLNFALDTLRVDGLFGTTLQLVNLVDNQPDYEGIEALYVDRLIVAPGSTLDLGGLPLYYRSAQILGDVVNGQIALFGIVAVPEPAANALFALAIVLSAVWRRK